MDPQPTRTWPIISTIAVLCLLTAGVGCDNDPEPPILIESPQQRCSTISADEGGTIGSAQTRIEVDFGPGALDEDTDVCIEWLEPPVDPENSLPDTTFRLTPDDLELNTPVNYSLLYMDSELPSDVDERNVRIHVLDGDAWEVDDTARTNTQWGIATSESTRLGIRTLRPMDNPDPLPDAGMDADAEDASDTSDATDAQDEDAATAGCSCVGEACADDVRPVASATGMVQGGTEFTETVQADALDTVLLTADGSTAGNLPESSLAYSWSIVERPAGSTLSLLPNRVVPDPRLFLELPGDYVIELRVEARADDNTIVCSEPARVTVVATPGADFFVSMRTTTPDDPDPTDNEGTAVTLHYLHPQGLWESAPWDCFWNNTAPDWGVSGDASDDPEMIPGQIGSDAPAMLRHSNHEDLIYQVGAYYLSSSVGGIGDVTTYATLRVYSNGQLVAEHRDVAFESQEQFLQAGSVSGATLEYTADDEMLDGFPND